ncbi:secoisolariciresinol dehydrogenase-like [Senna tora]|uniref:Secoisolariciresinol dehydrogenase-like n=1 Tax=Senna tora TaxID=362788 RepID=A0A834SYC9_9FABA|nr:secoisolariciresinol dehydrogenase-like [Senna tora]
MATASLLSAVARRLEGKVALVTGGASGIGECTARLFSKHGAKVVIADIQDELGHSVCQHLTNSSSSSCYVHCDITNENHMQNAVNTAVSKYGKLDIMLNNAGIMGAWAPSIVDNEKSAFEQVISVNLVGTFVGTKQAAKVMIPTRSGTIISIASVCGNIGGMASHAYTCSKHGVIGLMRNAAVELGTYGIRVNCVSPYATPTPMSRTFLNLDDEEEISSTLYSNLKGTLLQPQDIAHAALYLASDDSKYVSGLNLVVDGGFSIHNSGFCPLHQSY